MPATAPTSSERPARRRRLLLLSLLLFVFYLLHNDLWWWHDPSRVLGLPIGLTYHLLYCFAAASLMAAFVKWAWPDELDDDESETPS